MKTVKFTRFRFLIYTPLTHREFDIYSYPVLYFMMDKQARAVKWFSACKPKNAAWNILTINLCL